MPTFRLSVETEIPSTAAARVRFPPVRATTVSMWFAGPLGEVPYRAPSRGTGK